MFSSDSLALFTSKKNLNEECNKSNSLVSLSYLPCTSSTINMSLSLAKIKTAVALGFLCLFKRGLLEMLLIFSCTILNTGVLQKVSAL